MLVSGLMGLQLTADASSKGAVIDTLFSSNFAYACLVFGFNVLLSAIQLYSLAQTLFLALHEGDVLEVKSYEPSKCKRRVKTRVAGRVGHNGVWVITPGVTL